MADLRAVSASGLNPTHHGQAWRVLLGVDSVNPSAWAASHNEREQHYLQFLTDFGEGFELGNPLKEVVGSVSGLGSIAANQDDSGAAGMHTAGPLAAAVAEEAAKLSAVGGGDESTPAASSAAPSGAETEAKQAEPSSAGSSEDKQPEPDSTQDTSSAQPQVLVRKEASKDPLAPAPPKPSDSGPQAAAAPKAKAAAAPASKEHKLLSDILKDVARTNPELAFFQRKATQRSMTRVLFLFARLNPGVHYVQGMNELLAPLLFACASEHGVTYLRAEAQAFFLLTTLMGDLRDCFVESLDESEGGLGGTLREFQTLLSETDARLDAHLKSMGIDPRFYGIRWFTTLLSREFHMADTLRLWDDLFASSDRHRHLLRLAVGMLLAQRRKLTKQDFAGCLRMLQDEPPSDVEDVINHAEKIRASEEGAVPQPSSPGLLSGPRRYGSGKHHAAPAAGGAAGEGGKSTAARSLAGAAPQRPSPLGHSGAGHSGAGVPGGGRGRGRGGGSGRGRGRSGHRRPAPAGEDQGSALATAVTVGSSMASAAGSWLSGMASALGGAVSSATQPSEPVPLVTSSSMGSRSPAQIKGPGSAGRAGDEHKASARGGMRARHQEPRSPAHNRRLVAAPGHPASPLAAGQSAAQSAASGSPGALRIADELQPRGKSRLVAASDRPTESGDAASDGSQHRPIGDSTL